MATDLKLLNPKFTSTSAISFAGRILVLLAALSLPVLLGACGGGGAGGAAGGDSGGEDDDDDGGGDGGGTSEFDDYAIQFGMNSSRPGYAFRSILFSDLMMQASEFGEYNGSIIDLSASVPLIPYGLGRLGEGWPDLAAAPAGTIAGARLLSALEGTIPDGRTTPYVLEWSGTGSCRLEGSGVVGEVNRSSNRVEVFVDPTIVAGMDPCVGVLIDDSSAFSPVRDVHIWLPGTEATRPLFWQAHVDKVMQLNQGKGPYVWRATNWNQVNSYGSSGANGGFTFELDSQVTPRSPSQATRKGMSVEMVIAYANLIQRDLILNLPHRTDDLSEAEYASFLAGVFDRAANGSPAVPGINAGQAFRGLDAGLTLWIELSNEIWNPGFPVNAWMVKEADLKRISYEAQVAGEIAKMNAAALAAFSAPGDERLQLYVAGHVVDPISLKGILSALPDGTQVGAMGPAYYFSEQTSDVNNWLAGSNQGTGDCPNCPTVEELIDAGRSSIPVLAGFIAQHRIIANDFVNPDGTNPLLMLYEAGQHFVAGSFPWVEEVNAAQLHPDMYFAYIDDLIPTMIQEGVDIVVWFTFVGDQDPQPGGAFGPFGTWNTLDQQITLPVPDIYVDEQAPKAAAIYRAPPLLP